MWCISKPDKHKWCLSSSDGCHHLSAQDGLIQRSEVSHHPRNGEIDTGNCRCESDAVRGEESITKMPSSLRPSSNSSKGARSTCGVTLSSLANAHRNTFAHFSQDSHKSANNNNKKWEREQVFGRERYATIEGLLYWKMLLSVDSSICVETWDRKTRWQIRIQREAEREREGGGNERDEVEWGGKGERDKG